MLAKAPVPAGYATLAGPPGWDYVQEAWKHTLDSAILDRIEAARQRAAQLDDDGQAITIEIAGEPVQVLPRGAKGGFKWVLISPDFMLFLHSGAREWNVSVRHLAGGLWQHGWEAVTDRVRAMLGAHGRPDGDDFRRVTRVDWCFDWYSPMFSAEMCDHSITDRIVAHPSVKIRKRVGDVEAIGRPARIQTITIGSIQGLQVQVYDKGLELTEVSGKDWMLPIYEEFSGYCPPKGLPDLWRLELRFGKHYLKERNLRTPAAVIAERERMIAEALHSWRLTVRNPTDTNRRRWPLHPLWQLCHAVAGADDMPAIGRRVTGRREALSELATKAVAGALVSHCVLQLGLFSEPELQALAQKAVATAVSDPHLPKKIERATERYQLVDRPR
jgi:hypothetical protein